MPGFGGIRDLPLFSPSPSFRYSKHFLYASVVKLDTVKCLVIYLFNFCHLVENLFFVLSALKNDHRDTLLAPPPLLHE